MTERDNYAYKNSIYHPNLVSSSFYTISLCSLLEFTEFFIYLLFSVESELSGEIQQAPGTPFGVITRIIFVAVLILTCLVWCRACRRRWSAVVSMCLRAGAN